MFDTQPFVEDCRVALVPDRGRRKVIREVVARAVAKPAALLGGIDEPRRAGLNVLHQDLDLTVLNRAWGRR